MCVRLAAFVGFLLILMCPAAAQEYTSKGVTVAHPWARATPGGAKVGGAFFEMKAVDGKGDRLIAVRSPAAGSVEIHNHIMEGGVARMRRVDGIAVAGGKSVKLQPGGYHVMLMDLKQPLKLGDVLKLTLVFETAGDIEVDATIEPIGAMGPQGSKQESGSKKSDGAHGHKH